MPIEQTRLLVNRNQRKVVLKISLAGLVLVVGLYVSFITRPHPVGRDLTLTASKPVVHTAAVYSKPAQAHVGLPARLKIPKLNINAAIEYVGLTPSGLMNVTKSLDTVSWFKFGQIPGLNGSAVIAGHSGEANGVTAVFNDLHRLQPGDKLSVEDDKGASITFVVRGSRSYDPAADASTVFGSNDGASHLNLITCEGIWNNTSKSYSKRLVVFTDRL